LGRGEGTPLTRMSQESQPNRGAAVAQNRSPRGPLHCLNPGGQGLEHLSKGRSVQATGHTPLHSLPGRARGG
jgi:hypothetical protein